MTAQQLMITSRAPPATWNPLDKDASVTLSNGNLTASFSNATVVKSVRATKGNSAGKWYWEITITAFDDPFIGAGTSSASISAYIGFDASGWSYGGAGGGLKYHNSVSSAYGVQLKTGDVVGVALDMDGGTLTFYVNGVSQGQAFSGISGTVFPAESGAPTQSSDVQTANFGETAFAYAPPAGFSAL